VGRIGGSISCTATLRTSGSPIFSRRGKDGSKPEDEQAAPRPAPNPPPYRCPLHRTR
jgi:hypothetical protein